MPVYTVRAVRYSDKATLTQFTVVARDEDDATMIGRRLADHRLSTLTGEKTTGYEVLVRKHDGPAT